MKQTLSQPTVYANEADWLASRQGCIGASEVATILGGNPHKSPHAFWCQKAGLLPNDDTTLAMRRGHYMEPLIADLYVEATGNDVYDPGDYAVWSHPGMPYFRCTPDRLTCSIDMPVELKDIGHHISQQMRDGEPPLVYQAQVQAQMAILDIDKADLACFMDGRDFEVFHFTRNDRFINAMLAEVAEFHERLQNGDPPPIDGHPSTAAALAALHPDDNGETVVLSTDAIQAAYALDLAKVRLKELEAEKALAENTLKAAIGDATYAEAPGLRYSWKTQERAGFLRLADTPEIRTALASAGLAFTATAGSKFRVLRALKARA